MGRLYEELYEASSRGEYANQAIEFYKKAYELDPRAPVIGERLAEIYFKSQRIRDAVLEAQEILKRDPDNLPARRLLAHIYVRTLGDLSGAAGTAEASVVSADPCLTAPSAWLFVAWRAAAASSSHSRTPAPSPSGCGSVCN